MDQQEVKNQELPEEEVKNQALPEQEVTEPVPAEAEAAPEETEAPAAEAAAEEPEFDLDDIMKEFASQPGEALPQEEEEEPQPEEIPQEVTGDTIRLDTLTIEKEARQVKDAEPVQEEEPEEPQEAFSDRWEPEYEQPMGEYVPPQPIQFRPKSRLRELKKQLVAGPEKRYYTLAEKGVGKLQVAIFLNFLVVVLSAGATVMYALGDVQPDRMKLMIFGQFLAMLVSALLGSYQLIQGVVDVFHGRFTLKSLLVVTFAACCADGVLCLQQLRVPCCAAFSLEILLALCNTYQTRSAEMGQMDTMRKATRLDSLALCRDYYNGKKGLLRGEGTVEDFMDHYNKLSPLQRVLDWYALAALLASAGLGVYAGLQGGLAEGIQVAAVCLLAAAPASIFVTLSRPLAIVTRRLHNVGAVICGWQGVKALAGKAVFPMEYQDLYPAGSARMNGVKFYGDRPTDEVVAYCTAVIAANGSGLAPVFSQVLDSRNGHHYDAYELRSYDNGGIGAIVEGEAVLVGSMAFLKDMGVVVPEGIRVDQAVCVAIDGELCGLFALSFENNRMAVAGLSGLCGRRIQPIFTTGDFLLTQQFIAERFDVKTKHMLFPEQEAREALAEKTAEEDRPALALVTRSTLPAYVSAINGARALRTASRLGVIVHLLGGLLGIGAMVTLVLLGRLDLLTPANMFAYQLVWMIPGLLVTVWART